MKFFGFTNKRKDKKEYIVEWTEERKAIVEARDAEEALEMFLQDKIKREGTSERKNFRIEKLY